MVYMSLKSSLEERCSRHEVHLQAYGAIRSSEQKGTSMPSWVVKAAEGRLLNPLQQEQPLITRTKVRLEVASRYSS